MSMPVVYGIPNCDTVKRARTWLAAQGVAVQFHDVKKAGVPAEQLAAWINSAGWQRLLNRQGTSFRKLDETQKNAVVDATSASAVMLAQPSTIKRPVVQWPDGTITVGFDEADFARRV